ncbi:MAG TPA: beta-galactosidase [Candidatus Saccharimonadales bacterium]|nr:beta-galactosidase [Candidatus Saccharimonadales bacterium]
MGKKHARHAVQFVQQYWSKNIWHKVWILLAVVLVLWIGTLYGIARWYITMSSVKPLTLGASFIPAYAESLGLDPKQTMDALIDDVGVKHFRLVSYWDQLEPTPGTYDFSLLDWQFQKAEAAGARITLSLGLRQPRWPECHMPAWAATMQDDEWQPKLNSFIQATVDRYKQSPALDSYQLENEYFLRGFGICTNFSRERLATEYNLVKQTDNRHKVIISRSNNALGWPVGAPTPDEFGISIYKRVWDAGLTKRYLEYPFPAWFYASVAGWQKIVTGKDMIIHELQAETWPPDYQSIQETPLDEQNKSFNADRFVDRLKFGEATGMREIYLWGAEYWYYRLVKLDDPSLWNVAQQGFKAANNNELPKVPAVTALESKRY